MLTDADRLYIRANFRSLAELCAGRAENPDDVRALLATGLLPRPTYVLDDGTEMFPPDYFELVDAAGGVENLRGEFERRFLAAAEAAGGPAASGEVDEEWQAYLSGEYGACLREVTPESIVAKEQNVRAIEALLASPRPEDDAWRRELRERVDALDELEREFAPYDRVRFGGPVSRDRLITAVRERYPAVFGRESSAVG